MAKEPVTATREAAFDEAALVQQACAGDMNAFSRLVVRYQDRVLNTCWRICGNADDAQDLAQEAFLKVMEAIRSFRRQSTFYTWLFRVAVNLALGHRRQNARQVRLSLHHGNGEQVVEHQAARLVGRVSNEPESPAGRMAARETEQQILAAMDRLDDEHRTVVVLRDIEGFDYAQIAEILDVPVGTVKSRLSRARMELRERLQRLVADDE